ncbi:hypothetical protein AB6Q56_12290 [Dechloromonas sp. ARDL1]
MLHPSQVACHKRKQLIHIDNQDNDSSGAHQNKARIAISVRAAAEKR